MKKRWFWLIAVLVLLSTAVYAQFYTGAPQDDADLFLYDINNNPVGTANPSSQGKAKAISPGALLKINISNVKFNNNVNTGAFVNVDLKSGSTVMKSLNGTVVNSYLLLLYTIPLNWDKNYHVTGTFTFGNNSFTEQNVFKVQGTANQTNTTNQTQPPSNQTNQTSNCTIEICDGIDNDCDNQIDENLFQQCGTSNIGACSFGTRLCVNGGWGTCQNSTDPDTEVCNSIDDDCDGATDENLVQTCGNNIGACVTGTQTCSAGQWSQCGGNYFGPVNETCNSIDDDCDGQVDEGNVCSQCTDGQVRVCGTDTGICSTGNQTCTGGQWGQCVGSVDPMNETCNSVDDDCDGFIDESLIRQCGQYFQGSCQFGTETCLSGTWGICTGSINPTQEICNNVDDDCDGQVDESVTQSCGITNVGVCQLGTKSCSTGTWSNCTGAVNPVQEICGDSLDNDCDGAIDNGCNATCIPIPEICGDNIDNDCDGQIDEGCSCADADGDGYFDIFCGGNDCDDTNSAINPAANETCNNIDDNCNNNIDENLTQVCGTNVGICQTGMQTCTTGIWGTCTGAVTSQIEICNNVDDDCDSQIDENLTQSCGTDVGECSSGTQSCSAGQWNQCGGTYLGPLNETCNNLDDDCDGLVDNNAGCAVCTDGNTRSCGTDVGDCRSGTQTCTNSQWSACSGSIEQIAEICDYQDNDCDGYIDENLTMQCGTGDLGACQYGMKICMLGAWGNCSGNIDPINETCNNLDDDCDGYVDESLMQNCGTSSIGICQYGTQTCDSGNWSLCQGNVEPVNESCGDSLDNDCDGTVDNGCAPSTPSTPSSGGGGGGGGGSSSSNMKVIKTNNNPLLVYKPAQSTRDLLPSLTELDAYPVKALDLVIVKYPLLIDIVDRSFVVEAIVINTGTVPLQKVFLEADTSFGWIMESQTLESIAPNEQKEVVLTFKSNLCTKGQPMQERFSDSDVIIKVFAESGETRDEEIIVPLLDIPTFALSSAETDYSENNILRACFFVSNPSSELRPSFEIEFGMSDQRDDILIDYMTPIRVGANETLIKSRDYKIDVPRNKEYNLRAHLYEGGSLFTEGYQVGEGQSIVDLSEFEKQPGWFEKTWSKVKSFFEG